ncbi:MAG: hypothetical protein ACPG4T_19645, partial [Nannocystaceae bacterium]
GAWAVAHRGSLWICWRYEPGKSCLRRIVTQDNDTATVAYRRGAFFSETFVVATNTKTYVIRRGDNLATSLDPDDQLLGLKPFRRLHCAPEGWLPTRHTSGFRWYYKPCPNRTRMHCPAPPAPKLRRPRGIRLKLSLEVGRRVQQSPQGSQVHGFLAVTVDLGFALGPSAALARARLRRAQARPIAASLSSTIPELQARENQALRHALCPPAKRN